MRDFVGVWLGGLDGSTWWEQDADEPALAASLMKVPLAMAAMAVDLDAQVAVHPDFDSVVAGERFTVDEDDDQDPDTWAAMGGVETLRETARPRPPSTAPCTTRPQTWPGSGRLATAQVRTWRSVAYAHGQALLGRMDA